MDCGEDTDNNSNSSSDMEGTEETTKLIASLDTRRDDKVIIKKPIPLKRAAQRMMSERIKSYLRLV